MKDKLTIVSNGVDGGGKEKLKLFMDGVYYCEIYFNMRGWNVEKNIPSPGEHGTIVGTWIPEGSLAAIRKAVKQANKEWQL